MDKPAQYVSAMRVVDHGMLVSYVEADSREVIGSLMRNERGWHVYLPEVDAYAKADGKYHGYLIILNYYKEQNGLW